MRSPTCRASRWYSRMIHHQPWHGTPNPLDGIEEVIRHPSLSHSSTTKICLRRSAAFWPSRPMVALAGVLFIWPIRCSGIRLPVRSYPRMCRLASFILPMDCHGLIITAMRRWWRAEPDFIEHRWLSPVFGGEPRVPVSWERVQMFPLCSHLWAVMITNHHMLSKFDENQGMCISTNKKGLIGEDKPFEKWSGRTDSNCRNQLGRLGFYH